MPPQSRVGPQSEARLLTTFNPSHNRPHDARVDRPAADWLTGDVSYRTPTPAEIRAVRMLLPDLLTSARRVASWVAVAGTPQRIVAASALALDIDPDNRHQGLIQVRAIAPRAGQGIEAALLQPLSDAARTADHSSLVTIDWLDIASAAAIALATAGFQPAQHRYEYEGSFADALTALRPLYREIRDRGWIPADARIVPLGEADRHAVAEIHARHFGGDPAAALRILAGDTPARCDGRLSFVLLLADRVIGYTLGHVSPADNVCEFDWTAIEPAHRGGWANLWLRTHAAEHLLAAGVPRYRYRALDEHSDSRRAARRAGSHLVRTSARMAKAL